jgi:protein arginine kinase
VAIDSNEQFSVMINEEDHLRIQVMHSGLDLQAAWEQINRIDDLIEEQRDLRLSRRLGYLTACPTNVGTGMRVSVMLHLPALVLTRQIEKVFRSLQRSAWRCAACTAKARRRWAISTRSATRSRWAERRRLIKQVGEVVPSADRVRAQGARFPGRKRA